MCVEGETDWCEKLSHKQFETFSKLCELATPTNNSICRTICALKVMFCFGCASQLVIKD